ncbi:MAG: hypothetical protein ACRC06_17645, partial [Waterburya sp.]
MPGSKRAIITTCQTVNPSFQNFTEFTNSNLKEVTAKTPVPQKYLVIDNGICKAKLGMTVGELKKISPKDTQFEIISSFIVDLKVIAVSQKGIVQYYILYGADT